MGREGTQGGLSRYYGFGTMTFLLLLLILTILAYQEQLMEDQSLEWYIESRLNNATYVGAQEYPVEQVTRLNPVTAFANEL